MGKALAAWLMVAGAAVASPVTGPRDAVESAIGQVLSVMQDGAVNGKVVTRAYDANPRKGYICLESEGGEVLYRNIRIRQLPSSNPPAEMVAKNAEPYRILYNGVDLRGWKVKTGDLWCIGEHRLLCGESERGLDLIRGDCRLDAVITDPPYGINIVRGLGTIGGAKPFGRVRKLCGHKPKIVGRVGGGRCY